MRKRSWKIIAQYVVLGSSLLLAVAVVGGGLRPVQVLGNSMEPGIRAGDVVLLQRQSQFEVGDVIAYRDSSLAGSVVLHRIIGVVDGRYVSKGDNNTFIDRFQPTPNDVIGRSVMVVTSGEGVLNFLGSQTYFTIAFAAIGGGLSFQRLAAVRRRRRFRRRRATRRAPMIGASVSLPAPIVKTTRDVDRRRQPTVRPLGPDLSQPEVDFDECVRRMMSYDHAEASIAEMLLDQRVMRGVGNVYRSELLWATEMHPWAIVSDLSREECRDLVELMHEMLRANVTRTASTTASNVYEGLAVYGRQGKQCTRCGELVRVTHHGEANRALYWCSGCQTKHAPRATAPQHLDHDMTARSAPSVSDLKGDL